MAAIGPMRPNNITIIRIILDGGSKDGVIPSEKPTVPNAETTSNR
jgi:hypothetical protein